MSLTVLAPLRLEALALRRGLRDPGSEVVRTGMGVARSRVAAENVWLGATNGDESRAVAVAGLCGGVDPQLGPGDVVVASSVWREDGWERELPGADALAGAVRGLGLRCVSGAILSVERLARDARRAAEGHVGIVAVDMESAWLVEPAGACPVAVLRVVADAKGRSVYRPRTVVDGSKALRTLRRVAPALEEWAGAAVDVARPVEMRTIGLTADASGPAAVEERVVEIVANQSGEVT